MRISADAKAYAANKRLPETTGVGAPLTPYGIECAMETLIPTHPSATPAARAKAAAGHARRKAKLSGCTGEHATCLTIHQAAEKFGVSINVITAWVRSNFLSGHFINTQPEKPHFRRLHIPCDAVPNIPENIPCKRCKGLGHISIGVTRPKNTEAVL